MASLNDIRSAFSDYFVKEGHVALPSSSLVPSNDPTLLFTNAGMVQFKNVFTGLETRPYSRAVTSQKCVRAGGKHNDLDNVGYTARHHTFFEMLGNFSFGDYFKDDAIPLAWNLITREFGLPADRLLVTVYADDDDAAALWKKVAGLPDERIIRIATSDNFWSMGATGPCGPCSEIFFDHGEGIPGGPPGSPDEDGDRFIEIWNLVFMQFEQREDGSRDDLPRPSIDTGMGLERIGAVLQGKHDNYDTDLLRSLIEASADATSTDPDGAGAVHHRVIADHIRSTSFLIADGVLPSNTGRGYVLRRIIRRAVRHAHLLGVADAVLYKIVGALVRQMGQAFPELARAQTLAEETLEAEENRFRATLERGLGILDDAVRGLPDGAALPGDTAFRLYDTYGFPLDLTQDAMREQSRTVDTDGFEAAMAEQKARARAAWTGAADASEAAIWHAIREKSGPTEFLGYTVTAAEGVVIGIVSEGLEVASANAGETVRVALNQTPFYAESGGQVGDTGTMNGDGISGNVISTLKEAGDVFVHTLEIESGTLSVGQALRLDVDAGRRSEIAANHSATHLLHEALRGHLGDHVAQRGSLVTPSRLRFDFAHQKPMSAEEIRIAEREVNHFIRQNQPVSTRVMSPEAAVEEGARALFGEKYGDEVRVVSMGKRDDAPYSVELCGGTHVSRTGDIGLFAIASETGSAAGIRRIEALTGDEALRHLAGQSDELRKTAATLKTPVENVSERAKALLDERRALEVEAANLRKKVSLLESNGGGGDDAALGTDVGGISVLAQHLRGVSGKDLRGLVDAQKARIGSGAIILIAETDGKAAIAAGVTDDLLERLNAVALAKAASVALGGKGGGGRADFAQAGGPDCTKIAEALEAAKQVVADMMEGTA